MDDIKILPQGDSPQGDNPNNTTPQGGPNRETPSAQSFFLDNLIEPASPEQKAAQQASRQKILSQPVNPLYEPASPGTAVRESATPKNSTEQGAMPPQEGATSSPRKKNPKILVIIGALIVVAGIAGAAIYFGGQGWPFKGQVTTRLAAPEFCQNGQCTQTATQSATIQETCGQNEITNEAGQCVCDTNYIRNENTQFCEYDCASLVAKITDLRSSTTTSPETIASLQRMEQEAEKNKCEVPLVAEGKTTCELYNEAATTALATGDYTLYYQNSEKYIDQNCSGRVSNICLNRLGKAEIVNHILNSVKNDPALTESFRVKLSDLKKEYYGDSTCNNVEQRCSTLEPIYGATRPAASSLTSAESSTVESATSATSTTQETGELSAISTTVSNLTPSTVFKDDGQYYSANCKKTEATAPRIASCDQYLNNITVAVEKGTTRDIWQNSQKYIDENCSGNVTTACSTKVAYAKVLSQLIDRTPDENLKGEFATQFDTVKDEYFKDAKCNSEQMCSGQQKQKIRRVQQSPSSTGDIPPDRSVGDGKFNLPQILTNLDPSEVFRAYCAKT